MQEEGNEGGAEYYVAGCHTQTHTRERGSEKRKGEKTEEKRQVDNDDEQTQPTMISLFAAIHRT
ncbi:predicted protein [Uncinocarpus reesii 1704]|uniref:Uncharacterized protein n=1 Tax=Uncinocarpus reesii (strain UAMH 1704) TaxID=336963 RepID=C4JET0_UNCRE|nr:uncharacterized protein UREG_02240 [Uncinocarpus reesii 1704]EEP77391.1 predicted protein [Uncinocarpus reesii 1704]